MAEVIVVLSCHQHGEYCNTLSLLTEGVLKKHPQCSSSNLDRQPKKTLAFSLFMIVLSSLRDGGDCHRQQQQRAGSVWLEGARPCEKEQGRGRHNSIIIIPQSPIYDPDSIFTIPSPSHARSEIALCRSQSQQCISLASTHLSARRAQAVPTEAEHSPHLLRPCPLGQRHST
jgi:hypothetical protein